MNLWFELPECLSLTRNLNTTAMKRDRSGELRAVGIVFLVIPLTTVLARCYVRIYIVKKFAVDDWLAVVTMVFLAVYALLFIASASTGIGGHGATLTIGRKIVSMKMYGSPCQQLTKY